VDANRAALRVTRALGRRQLLAGAFGLSVAAFAGCGRDREPSAGATPSDSSWSFTDDTGATVRRPSRPIRIAGLTDQIAALWNLGIEPVAAFGQVGMRGDPQFEGKDISRVVDVGSTYGEISLEKLAATKPDLIVTNVYGDGKGGLNTPLYGFKSEEQQAQVAAIAPIVAIAQVGSVADVAQRNADLAAALGVGADTLADAKKQFDDASDQLRTAAESGVSVLYIAAYKNDGVYVGKAPDDPSLRYYTELGVNYPKVGGEQFYWHQLSWERVDEYAADVILYSTRALGKRGLMKQPTFAALPAAEADQIFPRVFYPTDHIGQAVAMHKLAGFLDRSHRVT